MAEIPLGKGSETDYLERAQKPAPVVPKPPEPVADPKHKKSEK
jgi:hypothetical protein